MPDGWEDRLVEIENSATGGGRGLCLERHDLAVSKLSAVREKDLDFVEAMLRHDLTNISILRERLSATLRLDPDRRPLIERWLTLHEPDTA